MAEGKKDMATEMGEEEEALLGSGKGEEGGRAMALMRLIAVAESLATR